MASFCKLLSMPVTLWLVPQVFCLFIFPSMFLNYSLALQWFSFSDICLALLCTAQLLLASSLFSCPSFGCGFPDVPPTSFLSDEPQAHNPSTSEGKLLRYPMVSRQGHKVTTDVKYNWKYNWHLCECWSIFCLIFRSQSCRYQSSEIRGVIYDKPV